MRKARALEGTWERGFRKAQTADPGDLQSKLGQSAQSGF